MAEMLKAKNIKKIFKKYKGIMLIVIFTYSNKICWLAINRKEKYLNS